MIRNYVSSVITVHSHENSQIMELTLVIIFHFTVYYMSYTVCEALFLTEGYISMTKWL